MGFQARFARSGGLGQQTRAGGSTRLCSSHAHRPCLRESLEPSPVGGVVPDPLHHAGIVTHLPTQVGSRKLGGHHAISLLPRAQAGLQLIKAQSSRLAFHWSPPRLGTIACEWQAEPKSMSPHLRGVGLDPCLPPLPAPAGRVCCRSTPAPRPGGRRDQVGAIRNFGNSRNPECPVGDRAGAVPYGNDPRMSGATSRPPLVSDRS